MTRGRAGGGGWRGDGRRSRPTWRQTDHDEADVAELEQFRDNGLVHASLTSTDDDGLFAQITLVNVLADVQVHRSPAWPARPPLRIGHQRGEICRAFWPRRRGPATPLAASKKKSERAAPACCGLEARTQGMGRPAVVRVARTRYIMCMCEVGSFDAASGPRCLS